MKSVIQHSSIAAIVNSITPIVNFTVFNNLVSAPFLPPASFDVWFYFGSKTNAVRNVNVTRNIIPNRQHFSNHTRVFIRWTFNYPHFVPNFRFIFFHSFSDTPLFTELNKQTPTAILQSRENNKIRPIVESNNLNNKICFFIFVYCLSPINQSHNTNGIAIMTAPTTKNVSMTTCIVDLIVFIFLTVLGSRDVGLGFCCDTSYRVSSRLRLRT